MLNIVLPLDAYSETAIPKIRITSPNVTRIVSMSSRGTFSNNDVLSITSESQYHPIQRNFSQVVPEVQEKLRSKWYTALAEARKLESEYPDPIQGMIDLLGDIPGGYESWREIIEEPYG